MRRFFVPPALIRQSSASISGDLLHHIAGVLRLKPGDSCIMADGNGHEAVAVITSLDKERAVIELSPMYAAIDAENSLAITLFQAMPKGDKLDLILQKSTELGISRVVPFNAERSVARLDGERLDKRISRWEKIVQAAARQSGRSSIPAVGFHKNLTELLQAESGGLKLLLWEGEKECGLRAVLERMAAPETVSIIVGPEGGLTSAEAAAAQAAGYIPVTLGSRILRTETAGLAVVSILQYLWGDLG